MYLIEARFDNGIKYGLGDSNTPDGAIAKAERNARLGGLLFEKAADWRNRNPQDNKTHDRVRRFVAHDGKAGHIAIYIKDDR